MVTVRITTRTRTGSNGDLIGSYSAFYDGAPPPGLSSSMSGDTYLSGLSGTYCKTINACNWKSFLDWAITGTKRYWGLTEKDTIYLDGTLVVQTPAAPPAPPPAVPPAAPPVKPPAAPPAAPPAVPPATPPANTVCTAGKTRQVPCPNDANKLVTQECVGGKWVTVKVDENKCAGDQAKAIIVAVILLIVIIYLGSRR